jgi:hypothetical protein
MTRIDLLTNPMTTEGDIIAAGTSGVPERLAAGSEDDVLTIVSGVPAWAAGGGGGGGGAFVGCVAQRTTDQTGIVTATGTIVSFTGTDIIDTDGFHDPAGGNPSRIIIPSGKDGKYRFTATILWEANATGVRQIGILVGGATFIGLHSHPAATAGEFTYQAVTSVPVDLVATNYVEVHVMQGSGGNRSLLGATVPLLFSCEFLGT